MARRFLQAYKTKRGDNLGDPEWHDRRWEDVDRRLHARELDSTAIETAVTNLEAQALARLNDTFTPLIERAVDQLTSVGVMFSAHSGSEVAISTGGKTFIVDADDRIGFVVGDFISARPVGSAGGVGISSANPQSTCA